MLEDDQPVAWAACGAFVSAYGELKKTRRTGVEFKSIPLSGLRLLTISEPLSTPRRPSPASNGSQPSPRGHRDPTPPRAGASLSVQLATLTTVWAALLATSLALSAHAAEAAQPRIMILATGGTIAGAQARQAQYGYQSGAFNVQDLIKCGAAEDATDLENVMENVLFAAATAMVIVAVSPAFASSPADDAEQVIAFIRQRVNATSSRNR
jgi:hypothetical protein